MAKSKILIHLGSDIFDVKRGGALATWTRKVYPKIADRLEPLVLSPTCHDPYPEVPVRFYETGVTASTLLRQIRHRSFRGVLEPIKAWIGNDDLRRAIHAVREFQPSWIHIHNRPGAVPLFRSHFPKAKVILHMNNDHLVEGSEFEQQASYRAARQANTLVFCSDYTRQKAFAQFPQLSDIRNAVIPNGADSPKNEDAIGNRVTNRILFVGRIIPEKGVDLLIDAFETVRIRFPDATLRIVGSTKTGISETDAYIERLKANAKPHGDAIQFCDSQAHDEVQNEFAHAAVFVCPSRWEEPFGMVNVEAMAAGVPVVAFARGGISEALGDSGILVHDLSAKALGLAIITLLKRPPRMTELSARGRRRVEEQFSWDVIARLWEAELEELLRS